MICKTFLSEMLFSAIATCLNKVKNVQFHRIVARAKSFYFLKFKVLDYGLGFYSFRLNN